jgi:hypothetical protein
MTDFKLSNTPISPRDRNDIVFVPNGNTVPPLDFIPFQTPIENQGNAGTCVSQGLSSGCEHISSSNGENIQLSALGHYYMTREKSGRLGEQGLHPRQALHAGKHFGFALESSWPYDLSKQDVKPPSEVYEEAKTRKISRYESVVMPMSQRPGGLRNHEAIEAAISEGMPVQIAMNVTGSLHKLSGPWKKHEYKLMGPSNRPIGRHQMVVTGYDRASKMYLIANSHGLVWGDSGYGGFPYEIADEFGFEAWVIRGFAGYRIPERPGMRLEFQNNTTISARYVTPKRGKTNLYMGGFIEGAWFLRAPITSEQLGPEDLDYSGALDKWLPMPDDPKDIEPTVTDYELTDDNFMHVVNYLNLSPFAGAKIFLAEGRTVAEAIKSLTFIADL